MAQDALARIGGHDGPPAARPLEQAHPGRALQRRDLHAHGRLRVAELLCGARERARDGDGFERGEVAHLDAEQSMRLFHHLRV